jgi:thiosulfate/3-mercaptopyruvate sulfurtransferase
MSYTTLISAESLAQLKDVKLLDCRAALGDPEHGRRQFDSGHLPGAQYLSLDDDLAAPPGEGGRHPLPPREALANRLAALGAGNDQQIVVYDDAGGAFAARAWWCIRWLGHEAVAVLDGGIAAWTGPLQTRIESPRSGDFSVRTPLTRTIDVGALLAGLDGLTLVDARSQARFEGREEPIDPVAGHIPGAVCRPFQGNLDPQGRFLPAEKLRARFASIEPGADTVCYCGSGVTAAHNVLAMVVAGFAEPMLYPGSWSEWLRSPERPIATHADS